MRIYCPNLPAAGEIELPEVEALHAIKVMRLKAGDSIEVFDGLGRVAQARITHIDKRKAFAKVEKFHSGDNSSNTEIVLGIGLPKGDRQRNVIERATELNIDRLVPLDCKHGVAVATDNAIDRARRWVIESCKQSERNRLMTVENSTSFEEWIREINTQSQRDDSDRVLKLLCHPRTPSSVTASQLMSRYISKGSATLTQIAIAIGPEGGFSEQELSLAISAGWEVFDLGPLVLRVETAVCVASTLARTILDVNARHRS